MLISSLRNSLVKQILLLQEKSRERKKTGLFVIEGWREIFLAKKGGYVLKSILFCSDIFSVEKMELLNSIESIEIIEISSKVYQKLAYRTSTEGILAIVRSKDHSIEHLELNSKTPLILVIESPEKPGNIGALLRTANAANLDAVIIANPKTDLYNPNIIRSGVGGLFTIQVAMGSTGEIISYLKTHKISIHCAALQDSIDYHTCDFRPATALVVGTEATGLSDEWLSNSFKNIIIPMQGELDSMNVSVAAGILIFEAKRQRNFS